MAKKKSRPRGKSPRRKTTGKRRDTRFKKGNKLGKKFELGNPGGPGRPANLFSPRAQLKRYAEVVAPEKFRKQVARLYPGVNTENLTWAQFIALAHLVEASSGNVRAIEAVYKQIDDHGAEVLQLEHKEPPSERVAKQLKKLRERRHNLEVPPGQPG